MIAEAFNSVQFPILPLVKTHATKGLELITRNPKLFTPRDFDYSPYFEIIKYPFIEFADYAMYRKLPWNREGLVSHDKVGVSGEEIELQQTKPKASRLKMLKERFQRHKEKKQPPEESEGSEGSEEKEEDDKDNSSPY
jgi:hypothetical protein